MRALKWLTYGSMNFLYHQRMKKFNNGEIYVKATTLLDAHVVEENVLLVVRPAQAVATSSKTSPCAIDRISVFVSS